MIDRVCFVAHVASPGRVAARLERATTNTPRDPDKLPAVVGRVGTLRASLQADRLIVRGSLPTYMGETAPLPRPLVVVARQRIEDALGIDLGAAVLWRLELTADLALSLPASAYLPLLVRCPRMQRFEYEGETVGFEVAARRLTFYDRGAERRTRKAPAPPGAPIRVELQYRKRLRRELRLDGPLTLSALHDPPTWRYLVSRWGEAYERVEKARAPLPFDALGDWRRGLQLVGLGVVGLETVEAAVGARREAGHISKSTMHAQIKQARALAVHPDRTVEDGRVAELDAAVRAAADRALACR